MLQQTGSDGAQQSCRVAYPYVEDKGSKIQEECRHAQKVDPGAANEALPWPFAFAVCILLIITSCLLDK